MAADNKKRIKKPALDRIIHEPARLQIISYLAAGRGETSFVELTERLGLTAGNLSVQLKRLEDAGYVAIAKSFRDNRPLTTISLTRTGLDALTEYLHELERMIDHLREAMLQQGSEQNGGGE